MKKLILFLLFISPKLVAQITNLPNVTIGTQIWQSSNLDVTTYSDGTPIHQVTDPTTWSNLTTGAWCYYNNDSANNATFGKLYNWYAVAGIYDTNSFNDASLRKSLAPQGWYIPSDSDWTTLSDYLGGATVAGDKLKEAGNSHWLAANGTATNSTGFTALPGGLRDSVDGSFSDLGDLGYWWSATEYNFNLGWYRRLGEANGTIYRVYYNKALGSSVRCLKNQTFSTIENELSSKIRLYPCPINNVLNVETDNSISIQAIEIYTIQGQTVVSDQSAQNSYKLDVSNFTTGTYIIKIITDKGSVYKKLLK